MTKLRKQILFIIIATIISVSFTLVYLENSKNSKEDMVSTTLSWGRLAPFPSKDFTIKDEGGMFSRAFRAKFKCEAALFEKWVSLSPGLKDTSATVNGNINTYIIKAGEGAQYAEVKYNTITKEVSVYVYWS